MSLASANILAKDLATELQSLAESNGSINAAGVVSGFRNVALDLGKTAAQLPTNYWQIFNEFTGRPPNAVYDVKELIKRIRAA